jgi:hypothetical protein
MANTDTVNINQLRMPAVFCGQCGRYVGAQTDCSFCGWQRPPGAGVPGPGEALWRYHAAAGWQGRLAHHAGHLFAADAAGGVHALHGADGAPLWPQPAALGARVRSLVADADHLYVSTRSGEVLALSRVTGQIIRRVALAESVGGLALAGDRLYAGGSEGQIIELTLPGLEGRPFRAGLKQAITAAPAVAGDMLLAVTRGFDGRLGVFSRRDGARLQVHELGEPAGLAPVVVGDRVAAVTDEGSVLILSLRRAHPPRVARVDDRVACLHADAGGIWLGTWGKGLLRLNWEGRTVGRWLESGGVVRGVATWAGAVFAACAEGGLQLLAGEPPGVCASHRLPGDPLLGPLAADGRVFAGTANGKLVALPWHLGGWRWAGEWCAACAAPEAAAAFRALGGEREAAARLWSEAGHPERAARMWESLGEHARAGEAFLAAAERQAGAAPVRAAGFYNLAAGKFRLAHMREREQHSRERAASMGNFPRLTAELDNLGRMEVGEPGWVALRLCNEGAATAHAIQINLGGQLVRMVQASLEDTQMAPGRELTLEVDNLVATVAGASRLVVRLTYRDAYDQEHVSEPAPFDLHAVEPEPGRVTVSGAEVGRLKIVTSKGAPTPSVRITGGSMVGSVRVEGSRE